MTGPKTVVVEVSESLGRECLPALVVFDAELGGSCLCQLALD